MAEDEKISQEELAPRCLATASLPQSAGLCRRAPISPDGTCILADSEDKSQRTFILPPDLLDSSHSSRHALQPFSTFRNPASIYASAAYPSFNLSDTSTTLVLSSVKDVPIRLSNALHPTLHATYPLINPRTEEFMTPHSLVFSRDSSTFIAGTKSLISVFDLTRPGDPAVQSRRTVPSIRTKLVGGGVGMKGPVSALAISCDEMLAAGTFTRYVGLYGRQGRGDFGGVFSVASGGAGDIGGNGITQLLWSPCGRYLYVMERKSNGMLVYDIRVAGRRLCSLTGRKAVTEARMDVGIVATEDGHEIWAGGVDGIVRTWKNPQASQVDQDPTASWKAHSNAVHSVSFHPSCRVVATCGGRLRAESRTVHPSTFGDEGNSSDDLENILDGTATIKVWSV